jgi:chromosome segregation protein
VKLLRLHLQGFKSFKDKTTIHFDDGITGIVGPNGCGKSNIVDALFWVMGEQSAKHLRGNKMRDLIFAGSSKYNPGGFAEVTLVLENDTGKHIHIGNQVTKPAEIALTRKLYRNGETEYRINNIPARLRDIQEVFMDTGAGAKSYSIIAQGEINRLVQAKPVERRVMIEEVAGVTKFKRRKKESLKKIDQSLTNLDRLSDLQSEIYKNLKSLEKQSEKAEKAKRLRDRVKHHELIVKSHKQFDYLTDFVNANTRLISNEETREASDLKKNQLELTLEDERIKKVDLVEKIDELQAEFNEVSRELAAKEERLKHLRKTAVDKEKQIEQRNRENDEIEKDIEARSGKLDELKEKLRDLEAQNFEEMDFSDLEDRVDNYKESLETKEEEIKDIAEQHDSVKEEFQVIDQTVFRNASKLEEYSASLEDITTEIEEIEKTTANASDELVNLRSETDTARDSFTELEEKFTSSKSDFDKKKTLLKEQDQNLRVLSKEVIQLESKVTSLKEINKAGVGVREGAIKFIDDSETTSFELLGNIIECEPEYAKALEVLFEESFDSLIGKDLNADTLANWHAGNDSASFDYLVPNSSIEKCSEDTVERLKINGLENVIAIESILKINNNEYKSILSDFFNGFYIVENLNSELALKVSSQRFKGLVSKSGNSYLVKTANGAKLSARSEDNSTMGVVQRNNLINELSTEFDAKNKELTSLEEANELLASEVDRLTLEVEELGTEKNEANNKFIALKSSLDSQESSQGVTSSRLEILTNRKNEISRSKLELLENEEDINTQKDDLEDRLLNYSDNLSDMRDERDELKSLFENSRGELLELQANAKSFTTQVESFNSQIEDVDSQVTRYKEKQEANNDLLDKFEEEITEAQDGVLELEQSNSDQAETLSDKEAHLNIFKDDLSDLLQGMQARENEVKELTSTINKIEKSNVELNLKVEQIIIDEEILTKDCFDRYRVDLRDVLKKHLELTAEDISELSEREGMFEMEGEDGMITLEKEEYAFDKRFPAALRESKDKFKRYRTDLNRLGEINWQAIEDYERQKLRHDFLKTQEAELKKSVEDLELAIVHIDEKSKIRFKEAYDEVNIRFTKVFPIIFGGGEARLEIVGDLESTECGIDIIAKPPGKKMQSINLMSGGEKAMTAVSLIFSIFLVKPSPFCLLDEVDAPLDDANVGRFNELLREMSSESQFILITHNKKTMELNDTLYGVTMQEPGVSKAVSVQLQ